MSIKESERTSNASINEETLRWLRQVVGGAIALRKWQDEQNQKAQTETEEAKGEG
jgi:hypothetical protein